MKMKKYEFSRTEILVGKECLKLLKQNKVAIFGIGGVGSFTAEALARTGIGTLILIDYDVVDITNINRQIHALASTVGKPKVAVMKERLMDINPKINIEVHQKIYNSETTDTLLKKDYNYVVDAIDMVSAKLDLIERCHKSGIPIISSMGAGNKMDPTRLEVTDIYKTSTCPLARIMRNELRKRGVSDFKVVYSRERPLKPLNAATDEEISKMNKKEKEEYRKKLVPGSMSFVPSVAGLIIAAEVVRELIKPCFLMR